MLGRFYAPSGLASGPDVTLLNARGLARPAPVFRAATGFCATISRISDDGIGLGFDSTPGLT
ncbi:MULTISPECIES: hypothetical protein [unclassified Marinovum]